MNTIRKYNSFFCFNHVGRKRAEKLGKMKSEKKKKKNRSGIQTGSWIVLLTAHFSSHKHMSNVRCQAKLECTFPHTHICAMLGVGQNCYKCSVMKYSNVFHTTVKCTLLQVTVYKQKSA